MNLQMLFADQKYLFQFTSGNKQCPLKRSERTNKYSLCVPQNSQKLRRETSFEFFLLPILLRETDTTQNRKRIV